MMMIRNRFTLLFGVLIALLALAATPARALVEIDINQGNVQPLPIAITDMISGDELGAQISGVIAADLKRSGLFAPVDKAAFIEQISNPDAAPDFKSWTVLNAQALVTGRVVKEGGCCGQSFVCGIHLPDSSLMASSLRRMPAIGAAWHISLLTQFMNV